MKYFSNYQIKTFRYYKKMKDFSNFINESQNVVDSTCDLNTIKPKINNFLKDVNKIIDEKIKRDSTYDYNVSVHSYGKKFVSLTQNSQPGGSRWGFISLYDGVYENNPIKVGDLMKAADYKKPAKGSRGNILDGTAKYTVYSPEYNTKSHLE